MPTQYPTLSQAEQTQRWTDMAKANLFPYTFTFINNLDTADYPKTAPNLSINYFTMAFQSDNNMSLSAIQVNLAGIPTRPFGSTADILLTTLVEISYSPVLESVLAGGPTNVTPVVPTIPSDIGNIIYSNVNYSLIPFYNMTPPSPVLFSTPFAINDFRRFEPYNYLLKYNQYLYMHVGITYAGGAINSGGTLQGSIILHTLTTGLKT